MILDQLTIETLQHLHLTGYDTAFANRLDSVASKINDLSYQKFERDVEQFERRL